MYEFFYNVVSDPWQVTALVIITLFFVLAFFGINAKPGLLSQLAAIAPNTLTSIGIFFTFLGILFALQDLNITDRDKFSDSVRELLNGLKLAFFSSVAGLLASVFFRVIEAIRKGFGSRNIPAEIDITHLYEQLKNLNYNTVSVRDALNGDNDTVSIREKLDTLNTNTLSVRDALVGEGDASLSTQFSKLRIDFKDYADKVRKDGTQELVRALEEVIKDFNLKISEQFGDNFKQLNEAVSALLLWQQQHKEQVEFITNAFNEVQTGIENVEKTVAKIPDSMDSITTVFDATNARVEQLYAGIGSLTEIRESAQKVIPELQKSIDTITISIKDSIDTQIEVLRNHIQEVQSVQESSNKSVQELRTHLSETIKLCTDKIREKVDDAIPEVQKFIAEISTSVKESLSEQISVIVTQIQEVKKIQTTSSKAVEELTLHYTEIIKNSANEIQESAKEAVPAVQKAIESIAIGMQETFKEQELLLRNQIQQVQDVYDSNNQAVKDLTAHFTETIKESASEIRESASKAVPEVQKVIESISISMQDNMNKQIVILDNQLQQVQEVSTSNSQAVKDLTKDFTDTIKLSANEIRESSQKAIPEIQKVIESLSQNLQESVSKQVGILDQQIREIQSVQSLSTNEIRDLTKNLGEIVKESLENTQAIFSAQISRFNEVLESLNSGATRVQESSGQISDKVSQVAEDFIRQQEILSKEIQSVIARSIDENRNAINQSLENMDAGMQRQVGRTIEKMGNSLVSINERFVESYEENARKIIELSKSLDQSRYQ